jgi:hypothetical protein
LEAAVLAYSDNNTRREDEQHMSFKRAVVPPAKGLGTEPYGLIGRQRLSALSVLWKFDFADDSTVP